MSTPVRRLPDFAAIEPDAIAVSLDALIARASAEIERLCAIETPDWENFVEPLSEALDAVGRYWSPVSHLNAVMNTDALRDAYNAGLQQLQGFYTDLGQNVALYRQYQRLLDASDFADWPADRRATIEHAVRDFKLSGVALEGEARERFRTISLRLSELGSQFQDNVLDATKAWERHITDAAELAGVPEPQLAMLAQAAAARELDGWLVTLEQPSYLAVITHADNRALREAIYTAYCTRASDQGPHGEAGGRWDNTPVIDELLALRTEKAALLGFDSYADYSLATKMADSPAAVDGFLRELAGRSRPVAMGELDELRRFAAEQGISEDFQPWDAAYVAEKLREHKHAISSEELKPYFPADKVVPGLFAVTERLFGVRIAEVADAPSYHPSVKLYAITDPDGAERGLFYLDLYARSNKRSGAWMAGCVDRQLSGGELQLPIAFLTANLTPPVGDAPALFDHDEVITIFHEFGHGLHHLLTRVDAGAVSGINGVEWDAVELPSQFLENWCWQRESLDLIAAHVDTGEPIPQDLLQRAQAARNFGAGMGMLRQIEFSLFDMAIHGATPGAAVDVQATLDAIRQDVAVMQPPAWNRFQHGFLHLFAGGYAAGYFSYKWAEVLSADAFARFEEEGIFDARAGGDFLAAVLERGGTRPAMENFVEFRGREPRIDALLRHSGLAA